MERGHSRIQYDLMEGLGRGHVIVMVAIAEFRSFGSVARIVLDGDYDVNSGSAAVDVLGVVAVVYLVVDATASQDTCR